MKGIIVALALIVAGTGALAATPYGAPLRDPLLDAVEAYLERPGGPHRGAHVDDRANVLGPHVAAVEQLAARFWSALGIDVQVVTLDPEGVELTALVEPLLSERLVAERATTGVLLIAIDAVGRQARVEVSYDLEGAFPDVVVRRVADDQLAPYASYNALGMAVTDVLHLFYDHALEQAVMGELPLSDQLKAGAAYQERLEQVSGGAGAAAALPRYPVDLDFKRPVAEFRRARYAPGPNPYDSIEAFLRTLGDLAGDPTLELFTPGSQVLRARSPMAPYEARLRRDRLEASRPLRLVRRGDRAVALSDSPVHGFVPIHLRRDDGLWRVDLVETWKNLFYDENGEYFLYNTSSPYAFGLTHLEQGRGRGLTPIDLGDRSVAEALASLENESGAHARLALAELLLRNCFVSVEALSLYEQAAELAPLDAEIARIYGERALYFGYTEIAIPQLKKAGPAAWHRVAHAYASAGDWGRAERYYRRALRRNPSSTIARRGLDSVTGR